MGVLRASIGVQGGDALQVACLSLLTAVSKTEEGCRQLAGLQAGPLLATLLTSGSPAACRASVQVLDALLASPAGVHSVKRYMQPLLEGLARAAEVIPSGDPLQRVADSQRKTLEMAQVGW